MPATAVGNGADSVGERISTLLDRVGALGDPAAAKLVEDLVGEVAELYGTGLGRVLAAIRRAVPEPGPVLDALADDELVAGLLALHDLHPHDLRARVERVVADFGSGRDGHPGQVRLADVGAAGVVRVRLVGGCSECASREAATVRTGLAEALAAFVPEITDVQVQATPTRPAGLIPPDALLRRPGAAGQGPGEGP